MNRSISILLFFSLILALSSCQKIHYIKYKGTPDRLISQEKAKNLYNNYKTRINPLITKKRNEEIKNTEYDASEYVWISIDELKQYIAFLHEIERKNKDQPQVSGIAMYLGAYNKDKSVKDENQRNGIKRTGDYRSRETIFLTPTYFDKKSTEKPILCHVPFYIKPNDPKKDKYVGQFLPSLYDKLNPILFGFISSSPSSDENDNDDSTGLSMNELNTVPPRN